MLLKFTILASTYQSAEYLHLIKVGWFTRKNNYATNFKAADLPG